MAPRANWKGFLKVAELTCPVALYTAASTSDRITFHTLNRATGNRVRRQFIDQETDEPVEPEEQVKGYEVGQGEYIVLEPDEIATAVPESDKTLSVESFLPVSEIDDVYFDRPYYLTPSEPIAEMAFAVVREGMQAKNVAALARAVLFRRVRTLLIRPHNSGLVATTLNFDYEVRSAKEAFDEIPDRKIKGEMLDLAKHIIKTKRGSFDPAAFEDHYETALAELVKAKLEGRPIEVRKARAPEKVVDLMEALRKSAGGAGPAPQEGRRKGQAPARPTGRKPAAAKGKATAEASRRRKAG